MSKFLGIDYGARRVGVAISDVEKTFAFPKATLPNDKMLIDAVEKIITDEGVERVVLGESLNFNRQENPIMKDIDVFKQKLEHRTGVTVHYEPEWMTSQAARKGTEQKELIDASAAALILQVYLDKQHNG